MNKFITGFTIVIFMLMLASCDRNKIFEDYVSIENNTWSNDNIIKFEFEINDTSTLNNVYINVRHASLYQYNNIWLFITSSAPNGTKNVDTVECVLINSDNKWIGDGMGDIWDVQIPWKTNIKFSHVGLYRVQFEQGMRIDELPGIMDMGLRVEKVD
jgi:gliding motility-associated lipoprotein GldH